MSNGNHVASIGNLTRDPELRFTPSGQATASFGVAVNRRWQNRQTQEWEEATSFFDVVCWGQLAENAAQSLSRGSRVIVSGRLDQRSWETPEGEQALEDRDHRRRGRPQPALGHRADHQERAPQAADGGGSYSPAAAGRGAAPAAVADGGARRLRR